MSKPIILDIEHRVEPKKTPVKSTRMHVSIVLAELAGRRLDPNYDMMNMPNRSYIPSTNQIIKNAHYFAKKVKEEAILELQNYH